ncbi:MAG: hypothetical protein K2M50_00940 [Treponemataceae bacterium]|nr:hypothetical protein [Treponema sp.]MDE6244204.1 hypothetical protein [Treponemataceae bacterium]
MKRMITGVIALFLAMTIFAQESKPVIGLVDLVVSQRGTLATGYWGDIWEPEVKDAKTGEIITPRKLAHPATKPIDVRTIVPSLNAALSQEIVNSGRFSVINMDSVGNTDGIDFLFESELTEFSADRDGKFGSIRYKMGVSVKFTNVKTGQIVLNQQFEVPITKTTSSKNNFFSFDTTPQISDPTKMPKIMASHAVNTIVTKLYPPMVLNVVGDVVQIPSTNMEFGLVVEILSQGDEIFDPYTGDSLGFDETLVAEVVVYDVKGRIASAKVDPKGKYLDAQIQKGMAVRATTKKNNKAARAINKAK